MRAAFEDCVNEFFIHLASQTSLGLLYDDPNKLNEVECDCRLLPGLTRGGFKRGLETPRCGFLLACNFTLGTIQRYTIMINNGFYCTMLQAAFSSGYYTISGSWNTGPHC